MSVKKYTYEQAKEIIEARGYKLLSTEYKNSKTPLEVQCGDCGRKYNVRLQSFIKGAGCKKCADDQRGVNKRTKEEDVRKLMEERGDTLIRLFFVRNRARVEYKCGKCGDTFTRVWFTYQRKRGCQCSAQKGRIKITFEAVHDFIEEQGDELISAEYIGVNDKLEIKCHKCNEIYEMCWSSYRMGCRCTKCNKYTKKTIDEVRDFIKENGDSLISEVYKNCLDKLEINCSRCNNHFMMSWSAYRQGDRCPKCGLDERINKLRHSQEYVIGYIEENGDKLLNEYVTIDSKLTIECGSCGKTFEMSFRSYRDNFCRCSCKSAPKGERLIEEYLIKNNIPYETQKTFPGCKKKIALRFDFYLPTYDVLIEFDGSIHFKSNELLGGDRAFQERKESDMIKNVFCLQNNKRLLRISYNHIKTTQKIVENYLNMKDRKIIEYSNLNTYSDMIMDSYKKFTENREEIVSDVWKLME